MIISTPHVEVKTGPKPKARKRLALQRRLDYLEAQLEVLLDDNAKQLPYIRAEASALRYALRLIDADMAQPLA